MGSTAAYILLGVGSRINEGAKTYESRSELTLIRSLVERLANVLYRCAGPDEVFPVFCKFGFMDLPLNEEEVDEE